MKTANELTREQKLEIANTIIDQFGGGKFQVMTGSRDFVALDSGVQFKVGRNSRGINKVTVEYDRASDLYNMKFEKISFSKKTFRVKRKEVANYNSVYGDQLAELFTDATGLYTRL